MGRAGIIIERIAGMKDFDMISDLNLKCAGQDDIYLLALVCGQFYRSVLGFLGILGLHIKGLGNPVLEGCGKVVIGHAVRLLNLLSLALLRIDEFCEVRRLTFDKVSYVYAESLRAAVKESKVQVLLSRFTGNVFLFGYTCLLRHKGSGVVQNLTKFADSLRHLDNLEIETLC